MRKLRLNPEELSVESFGTGPEPVQRGTVHGHLTPRCNTDVSCGGTCGALCQPTYYCVPTEETCDDMCIPATGSTSCDQPCVYTCGGDASCNPNDTCIHTCQGMPTCGVRTCPGYPGLTCGC